MRAERQRARYVLWIALTALLLSGVQAGCELTGLKTYQTADRPVLSQLVAPKDGIELQIFFVERPRGDILVGEALWGQLNEINGIDAQARVKLRQAGFRCGVSGSSPPRAIRAIVSDQQIHSSTQTTRYQQVTLLSGDSAELQAASFSTPIEFRIPGQPDEEARRYESARCVLRVSGERVQEGWVRLQILPEIHYGPSMVRRIPSDHEWSFSKSQEIDPLYDQRLDVELNIGEIVVLGAARDDANSVGRLFFFGEQEQAGTERVLVIRVAGMQRAEPVLAHDW